MKHTWQNSSCSQSLSGQCGVHRVLEEKMDSSGAGRMVGYATGFQGGVFKEL